MTLKEFSDQARAIVPAELAVCVTVERWHHTGGQIETSCRIWWSDPRNNNGSSVGDCSPSGVLSMLRIALEPASETAFDDMEITPAEVAHG